MTNPKIAVIVEGATLEQKQQVINALSSEYPVHWKITAEFDTFYVRVYKNGMYQGMSYGTLESIQRNEGEHIVIDWKELIKDE